jgi:integrase
MSENGTIAALQVLGIPKEDMSNHGWRAVARTLLDESLGFRVELIEMQLAHSVRDVHGTAYNRTKFIQERHKMMQCWANYLNGLKGAK